MAKLKLSWPSDKPNLVTSYDEATLEEGRAARLLPFALAQIRSGFGKYPSVIAHSMGAKLYSDGIRTMSDPGTTDSATHGALIPATILAAPDISHSEFEAGFRRFSDVNSATTVYCTLDIALIASSLRNGSELEFGHFRSRRGYRPKISATNAAGSVCC